jgi:hypothetical protein
MAVRSLKRKRRNVSPDSGSDRADGNVNHIPPIIVTGDATSNDDGATDAINGISNSSKFDVVEPSTAYNSGDSTGTDTGTDTGTRTRRKRGPNRTRKADSETTKTLGSLLYTIHLMGSSMLNAEEFSLTAEESETLAEATTRVSQLYDIAIMGEKTAAWIGLAFTAGTIYGPRALALRARQRTEAKEKPIRKVQAIN